MVALGKNSALLDRFSEVIRENEIDSGANHLYSVAALTDAAGSVVERYRYDAYGNRTTLAPDGVTTRAASSYNQQVGFTGRYLDKETGLWYFRARYYSGSLGRFIGRDSFHGVSIKTALKASDKQSQKFKIYSASSIIVPEYSLNEFMQPMAGDGYQDGANLMMAYFVVNGTDPTGYLNCCKTILYAHPKNSGFTRMLDCWEDYLGGRGYTSIVEAGVGGYLGSKISPLAGLIAGIAIPSSDAMSACTKYCAEYVAPVIVSSKIVPITIKDLMSCPKDRKLAGIENVYGCPEGSIEW